MYPVPNQEEPQVEIYFHDKEEQYSPFPSLTLTPIILNNDTKIEILLTPQVMEFQDKPSARCSMDPSYSYVKVSLAY